MAMEVGGDRRGPFANPNVTPLVDVLLVLLIIFMVITPMTPEGLPALIPQPAPPHEKPNPRTIVVDINKDGSLTINQQPIAEQDLGQRLQQIFARRAEDVIFVKADPDLNFEDVAKVIDIAHGAGIDKIGLLTGTTKTSG
jgi:biopolymer transport protein TolR